MGGKWGVMKILVWGSHQTEMGFREKVTEVKCLHHIRSTCYQRGLSERRFPCGMGPGHWQVVALSFFFYLVLPRPFPTQTRSEGCEYLPLRTPELFHGEMSQEPTLALWVSFVLGAGLSCCDLGRNLSTPLVSSYHCLACCP